MPGTIDGDLAFFHALQQRGLRARRHAVHFVYKKQVSEYRAAMQLELTAGDVQHIGPEDVSGHEVRGALHSLELQPEQQRQSLDRQRFRDSWNSFQQSMAAAQQGDQALRLESLLANNHSSHFPANVLRQFGDSFHYVFSLLEVGTLDVEALTAGNSLNRTA